MEMFFGISNSLPESNCNQHEQKEKRNMNPLYQLLQEIV